MNYPSTLPNPVIPFDPKDTGEVLDAGYRGRSVLVAGIDFPLYACHLVYPKLPWALFEDLQEFVFNRKFGALPFTFTCPIGHDAATLALGRVPGWRRLYVGVGDGATATFDLPLKSFSGLAGTDLHIYVAGVEVDAANYDINLGTGRDGRAQVVFHGGFEPGVGDDITVSGKFQRTIDAKFTKAELSRPTGTAYVVYNTAVDIGELRLDA